ncbi:MAG: sensor histidine kinase [Syntrophomonadaceae bacterium]|jgi:two-component system sensor histidine kinase DegS|nr:sensor histidine kinase [Syntrophomonadaceae bacterium]
MNREQPLKRKDYSASKQAYLLDQAIGQVVDKIDLVRNDIFAVAQECEQQRQEMQAELREIEDETANLKNIMEAAVEKEREARVRLMEVSSNFYTYSEDDIKSAYDEARLIQIEVLDYKQREVYLLRRKDELSALAKQLGAISDRADAMLNNTHIALQFLTGNTGKLSEVLKGSQHKDNMEMWIIESQESERRRIARDLHDGPAQTLAGILIRLDLIENISGSENISGFVDELHKVREMGRESLAEIRRIMYNLKPTFMQEEGFVSTIKDYFQSYEDKYDFPVRLITVGVVKKYPLPLEIALFRIVQEAVSNAHKHSGAAEAAVKVEDTGRQLTVVIKDGGRGFNPRHASNKKDSYGILGMKERVALFNGVMEIESSDGSGTQVTVKIPLNSGGVILPML